MGSSFLKCNPSVFVIGNDYEILVVARENGILGLKIKNQIFYEENSGVLSSEKDFAKIRVPQAVLDGAKEYTVVYKKTINRKGYFSEFESETSQTFKFIPIVGKEELNVYHVADVHKYYDEGVKTCSYFGDELDLLIVNGDIGELESKETYEDIAKFVGEVSKGEIPVIFARGNHDTRGKLVEKYTDYFPVNGKNTYFTFDVGNLCGVVFDCGEDKTDDHDEYGGANDFFSFRKRQTEFFKNMKLDKNKIRFAVGHICPCMTTEKPGNCFDIERDTYSIWTKCLEREDISFMLCGHLHRAMVLQPNCEKSIIKHDFPVVIGSALKERKIVGTAIVLSKTVMKVRFTDGDKKVLFEQSFVF